MTDWGTLLRLFLLERPQQWASLLAPERDPADRPAARRFLRVALAVGFMESLALYVVAPSLLYASLFWLVVAHVAWRHAAYARRLGRFAAGVAFVASAGASYALARASGPDVWTWCGAPGPVAAGEPGRAAPLAWWLVGVVATHAIPECFLRARGRGVLRGVAFVLFVFLLSAAEWKLVAASIGFPGVLLFPDLANAVDLGREEGLWVVPFWTALTIAHAAVEFRRGFRL